MIVAALYLVACLVLFLVGVYIVRYVDQAWSRLYNPYVIISGGTLLYTLAPCWAAVGEQDPALPGYLTVQLVALAGITAGSVASQLLFAGRGRPGAVIQFRTSPRRLDAITVISMVLLLVFYSIYFGGIVNIFKEGYSNITGAGLDSASASFIVINIVLLGFPVLLSIGLIAPRLTLTRVACAMLYVLLLIASGTRNYLLMFGGGVMMLRAVLHPRMSYLKLGGMAAVLLLVFGVVGLYRNFGMERRFDMYDLFADHGVKAIDPSSQELSTAFNVYRIHMSNPAWYNMAPGESYGTALLSIVPTVLWNSRPLSISTRFSNQFAGLGEGLGFSNNLEAYLSAGLVGVFVVNALLMLFVGWAYCKHVSQTVTPFGLAMYSNLAFLTFNWNRIDFQTVFKISLIRILLFYIAARFLLNIVRAAPTRGGACAARPRRQRAASGL